MRASRVLLIFLMVWYVTTGSYLAGVMSSAMPAINPWGMAYITLTWPFHMKMNPIRAPIPAWVFTFER
jgi:hypothetical protein